ncbi:hypothetical protein OPQ81_002130 [Rhizoctonia solani]|nr:hypothetical protein OPQ81_002130 [Rhizoctonia solani]
MGQAQASSIWETYRLDSSLAPGTYRIVHDWTDKVLQLKDDNSKTLALQSLQQQGSDSSFVENDHWFLLRSGDGFIFKHCRLGTYISGLFSTAAGSQYVCATRYPTTWVIHKKEGDDAKCGITIPLDPNESESERKYVGLGVTWAGLCIAPLSEKEDPDQVWRLERIGDETAEENDGDRVRELERQLQVVNARKTSEESELNAMRRQLERKEVDLENIRSELSEQATELENVRGYLSKRTEELKEQFKALDKIRDLLDAKGRALSGKEEANTSSNGTTIREKDPHMYQEEESLQNSGGFHEQVVLNEQFLVTTVRNPQCEDTKNPLGSNTSTQQLVAELAPTPEIAMVTVQPPHPHAAVDLDLAKLGWFFD